MSQLSEAEKNEIRAAVKLATDTFMVTPLQYFTGEKFDRWGEGSAQRTGVALNALAEYGGNVGDKAQGDPDGVIDFNEVTLTLNFEDVFTAGLVNPDYSLKLKVEEDYFILQDRQYKVIDAFPDGPLETRNLLVVIKGKLNSSDQGLQ